MSYNVVFLYIKDFLWNFIFETLDDKKNNMFHEKYKKTVNRNFLKKNRKNPIFWGKSMSYNVVFLYIKDFLWNFIFETLDDKKNNMFHEKYKKTVNRNFLKKNRKNPIFWGKLMSYNVVFLYIKDFLWNFIFETLDDKKNNQKIDKKIKRRS